MSTFDNISVIESVAEILKAAIENNDRHSELRDDVPSTGERFTTGVIETLLGSMHRRVAFDGWLHTTIDRTREEAKELLARQQPQNEVWCAAVERKVDFLKSLHSQLAMYEDAMSALKTAYHDATGSTWVPFDSRVATDRVEQRSAAAWELEQLIGAPGIEVVEADEIEAK